MVPIPKTSPPSVEHLRPISLTDHFAKVAEKLMASWALSDMQPNVDKAQFGNQKKISTSHYLISLIHAIHRHADIPKSISTVVSSDYTKAFDRIDHNLAITNLFKVNVCENVVAWICDFLSNRTQCVKYQNTFSDWREIKSGAPQGTRLGPIIFLAMINDACNSESIPCWKYVDDLTLLECRNINAESNIQQAVDHLPSWSEQNHMRLNPESVSQCTSVLPVMSHPFLM